MERKSRTPKKQLAKATAIESERQTENTQKETPDAEKYKTTHALEDTCVVKTECDPHKSERKRPRKIKNDIKSHSILEGFKRRKLNFEVSAVLSECEASMQMPETPLVQTPRTFFKSLCGVFDLEFPDLLSEAAINTVVSMLDTT